MILNTAPQDQAVISNVGQIGEFRIRNSAKAFNILSSGLYANKIRAIIRELSCNAVDSHVAAGKKDTAFDVHLPNQLEPHFSIRDYGTGLSHEQVTNIYTTYFESTKTSSNDFIGALGLGSKSPFSYTDNFTVTAIKDGRKGIYTAFINEQGVPSIALMMEEATDEPAGVEVKFSVNDRYDFDKFRQEARIVYTYFSLKPNVSGSAGFEIPVPEYESLDIIPGVHTRKGSRGSIAIMGNIAYPIEIPNSQRETDGDYFQMLNCGLEMHFGIGELDFQASREGLSYIPETITAIKAKLVALGDALTVVLAKEADAIPNLWDRAIYLVHKREHALWAAAVNKYVADTKLATVDTKSSPHYIRPKTFNFKVADLVADYNIMIRGFSQSRHNSTLSNLKENREYSDTKRPDGHYDTWNAWHIAVSADSQFVINDTKVGATQRAKEHFRARKCPSYNRNIYVIEAADRNKPVKTDELFAAMMNPPKDRIHLASTLDKQEREAGIGRNVSILKLEKRNQGGYSYRRRDEDMVWRDAGKFTDFDSTKTYYYMPLSGFNMESTKGYTSGKDFFEDITSLSNLFSGELYGVRKSDIATIKLQKNWINIEEHITKKLNASNVDSVLMSLVRSKLDNVDILNYNSPKIIAEVDAKSPFAEFVNAFKGVDKFDRSMYNVERLFKNFAPNASLNPDALVAKYQVKLNEINRRYPLLTKLSTYRVNHQDIAEYINLIDAKKGI